MPVTIQVEVKNSDSDGTVEALEIILKNEQHNSIRVGINPLYFEGIILILKRDDTVVGLQHSTRYSAIRSGPMPMAEIVMKPDQSYNRIIYVNELLDLDGKNVKINNKDIKTIIAVSETIWFKKDGQVRNPLLLQ